MKSVFYHVKPFTGRRVAGFVAAIMLSASGLMAREAASSPAAEEVVGKEAQSYFSDPFMTKLKPEVSSAKIEKIEDAVLKTAISEIKAGTHDFKMRNRVYEAYDSIRNVSQRQKTNDYSRFENPTGIYFEEGDKAILFVEGIDSSRREKMDVPSLLVRDFPKDKESYYLLKNGLNVIELKNGGTAYFSYYTENHKIVPKVKVHILGGKVNGFFDSSIHKAEDWAPILNKTCAPVLDIVGKHVQLIYATEQLKQYCPERGLELINLYDEIIDIQYEMMGLVKYNQVPKNRMLGRSIWRGFMHADGMGAAFHYNTLKELADPDALKKRATWGVAHEFGHVNQVRPGMKWVSTTEVTNNLYSIWTQYRFNPSYINLEDELHNDGDGNRVKGGRFNAYLNYAIVHGEQWLCQRGPDKMNGYENGGDHFVKLCPLWQLQLYFMKAKKGNTEFLADIFEIVRKKNEGGIPQGRLQLNFMKNVCDVTRQNLTDFFVTIGMLKPIDKDMDDYGRAQLTITQEECDELIAYARKYKKPESPVIQYISRRSVDAYAKRLSVKGAYGKGITEDKEKNTLTVSHSVWKNVTVFEAYKGKELVRITLVGTDYPEDNSATLVQYPEGCTRLEAVAWNGKRTLVYGKREGKKK